MSKLRKMARKRGAKATHYSCDEENRKWTCLLTSSAESTAVSVQWGAAQSDLRRVQKNADVLCKEFYTQLRKGREVLKSKLNTTGIHLVFPREMDRALRETLFDVNEAYEYAVEYIYTPLKLSTLEIRQADIDLGTARQEIARLCAAKGKASGGDEIAGIDMKIASAQETQALLNEKRILSKNLISSAVGLLKEQLEDAGLDGISLPEVRNRLVKEDWNAEEAYEKLLRLESMKCSE